MALKKVGILLPSLGPRGGVRIVLNWAMILARSGYRVELILPPSLAGAKIPLLAEEEIRLLHRISEFEARRHCYYSVLATTWSSISLLAELNADCHAWFMQAYEAQFLERNARGQAEFDELIAGQMNMITTARWLQQHILRHYNVEPKQAFFVLSGLDKTLWKPWPRARLKARGRPVEFLVEGPVTDPRKNVAQTIRLLERMGVRYRWVGSRVDRSLVGPNCSAVEAEVPYRRMPAIYAAADVLVKASNAEGMFGPPLEMFATGGTAVAWNVQGSDEYMSHWYNSLLVPMNSWHKLAETIRELVDAPERVATLQEHALLTAEAWPTWDDQAGQVVATIESLVPLGRASLIRQIAKNHFRGIFHSQPVLREAQRAASEAARAAGAEAQLAALEHELHELASSRAWRLVRIVQRVQRLLAPEGSRRWTCMLSAGRLVWRTGRRLKKARQTWQLAQSLARNAAVRLRRHSFRPPPLAEGGNFALAGPGETDRVPAPSPYDVWVENNRWNEQSARMAEETLKRLPRRPLFSIIMPVYNVEDCWLERAVASVECQVYPNWELCIADDGSTVPNVPPLLRRIATHDPRIRVCSFPTNRGISVASNAAARLARGEYLVLLDQDDELAPDCLLELARAVVNDPSPDIVYSDDDKIDASGRRSSGQFKPDWSPELLLTYMYFSHIFCISRALFEAVGGFRAGFEGCQDYDLALRATEQTDRIAHVAKVLYHWRTLPGSTASSGAAKPEAFERGIRAVQEALDRRRISGRVSRPDFAVQNHMGFFQIDFPDEGPTVAVIILARNGDEAVRDRVRSISEKTTYRSYEIVVADARADPPARVMNQAALRLDTEFVLFLSGETEVARPEWLSQMVGYAQIAGVGAVGARLLSPDGRVQHAGVITGHAEGMPRFAFASIPRWDGGYLCYALAARNYSAVTGACLMVRRSLFHELGGFDEERFRASFHDVDLCLRMRASGIRAVVAPRAELIHHDSEALGERRVDDPREAAAYRLAWGRDRDPYYNPNLTFEGPPFGLGTRRVAPRVAPSQLPLRVLFCNHDLGLEGAPLYVYRLALGLQARGRLVPEIYAPCDGPLAAMYREAGIPVHLADFAVADTDPRESRLLTIRRMAQWIRRSGFDLVHGNTLSSVLAIEAARAAGLPSLWTIHESVDYRHYFRQFGPEAVEPALRAFTFPYRVVFVAHATRALYEPLETRHNFGVIHVGLRRDEIERFMADCTPDEARRRIECPGEKRVITIVGTVADRKGQLVFARAALELLRRGRRDMVLQIVGCRPSPYLDELLALIKGHEAAFRLVAATRDVHPYYRASDIYVCCSTNESYPAVILEAMAFALPIVTTPVFGIAEQVVHGASALTFPPGDVAALLAHLERLLDNPAERGRLGQGARAALDTIITHDEMIEAYETLMLEAFAAGARDLVREIRAEQRGVA
jgi:glycosyltransferase involved in cell wall biosynthesis/GT2 family glycosyltransferase